MQKFHFVELAHENTKYIRYEKILFGEIFNNFKLS
jgi:hypothetical protein